MEGQGTPGGMATEIEANSEIQAIADTVKPAVQEKLGRELQVYQAKSYCWQVVAGTNYFIKILTGPGDECIHVRVLVSLPHVERAITLHGIQEHKKSSDPLIYF
ncbi:cystatin-B-like [Hypanus sabinus]|uniref:cystatin-B-like n=1 Tax=Hypanus sabinus TaxID=79690 RepID=UPI0028C3C58C|nr:cystatin-B-like [Hypanus sabinus]